MGKASFWSDDRLPCKTGPRREIINETMVFGRIPYPVTCLSVGNPHLVILMDETLKGTGMPDWQVLGECQTVAGKDWPHMYYEGIQTGPVLRRRCMREAQAILWLQEAAAARLLQLPYRLGLTSRTDDRPDAGRNSGAGNPEDGNVLMTGDVGYVGKHKKLGNHFTEQLRALDK